MEKGKICRICREFKPESNYSMHVHTKDGLRTECKTCATEVGRQWKRNNRERHNANRMRRYYEQKHGGAA